INEEWLADKSRHATDGLMRQRLDRPYVRVDGRLRAATWAQALASAAERLRATSPERIGVIAGDLVDAEQMKAALDLFGGLGVESLDCRQDGMKLGAGPRESWLFNTTIAGVEKADALLLVGTNPRKEAPILNQRIRKAWAQDKLRVAAVGEPAELTYGYDQLGAGPASLQRLGETDFGKAFTKAERPMVIVGAGALSRPDGAAVAALAAGLHPGLVADGWNGWNVLHTAASRVGGLDLGFIPRGNGRDVAGMLDAAEAGELDVVVLMGADEIDTRRLGRAFVIYMGHHGDAGANRADLILPGGAYTEKPGTYVNTEGRVQRAQRAIFPKGEAKEDWAILRALSAELGRTLPYDTVDQLRTRMIEDHPTFGQVGYAPGASTAAGFDLKAAFSGGGEVSDAPFKSPVKDYYLTNPIARASVTMAECSAVVANAGRPLMAAE
ncbi:MAG: molybdopterin-dependent oxidoreductase, partial [Caulobacteraceae bacterium]|nr:molybdopterin-dependent oxidoreductase [Caulobacter sp.]